MKIPSQRAGGIRGYRRVCLLRDFVDHVKQVPMHSLFVGARCNGFEGQQLQVTSQRVPSSAERSALAHLATAKHASR